MPITSRPTRKRREQTRPKQDGVSGRIPPHGSYDPGGGGSRASFAGYVAIALFSASVLVMFLTLSVAFFFRRTDSSDWAGVILPPIIWWNTLILLGSSGTIEMARWNIKNRGPFTFWWSLTASLGFIFLIGQIFAWNELLGQGNFFSSNPANSFFYLVTSMHGLHLLGGLIAINWIAWSRLRGHFGLQMKGRVGAVSFFWHFMGVLWLFLLFLLWSWR